MSISLGGTLPVLITQIIAMFLMMAAGFALYRAHMIDDDGVAQLSNIVLYAASPALVIESFVSTEFSMERISGAVWCIVLSVVLVLISMVLTRLVYGSAQPLAQSSIIFTNCGFIGIPLVQNVLGEEYVFYVSVSMAVTTFFAWTYGVWLITQDRSQVSFKKIFTNPGVISLFLGVALYLLSVDLPEVLDVALDGLGDINGGGAMIVLGAYLAQTNVRELLRDRTVYLANFLRLIVMSLVTALVLIPAPISTAVKLVLLITFSTPSGALTAMFAQKFGGDYRYAVGLVALSTVFSLVTMPIMLAVGLAVL